MNGTELGTCQVIIVRREYDVHVDLLLAGAAWVEGYALVPGSPVSAALVPPTEPWARRRMLRVLRGWSDASAECTAEIGFGDEAAVLTLRSGRDSVAGELTDLDVLFASDVRQTSEQ